MIYIICFRPLKMYTDKTKPVIIAQSEVSSFLLGNFGVVTSYVPVYS